MKLCPYCAEEIQDSAIKCRYCGEFLEADEGFALESSAEPLKWYFKTPFLVLMFMSVGPLALPLLWLHPRLSRTLKIVHTVWISVLSAMILVSSYHALVTLVDIYSELMQDL